MSAQPDVELVDDVVFELQPFGRRPLSADNVCLRKSRIFVDRYLEMAREFAGARMVEVGVDRGGGTAFFLKLFDPEALVAIELSEKMPRPLQRFLDKHDTEGRVRLHLGLDQSDRRRVPEAVEEAFGDAPLDLVIDDASHLLEPSTATFEMLFPRLRPGGIYVLEDWAADHLLESRLQRAVEEGDAGDAPPGGENKRFAASTARYERQPPTSALVAQFNIAAAFRRDWVAEVRTNHAFCEVRRGPAPIPGDARIVDYIGRKGARLFASLDSWPEGRALE